MSADQIRKLLQTARRMDRSTTQVELFEQAVREADAIGWDQGAFDARKELMSSAELSGNGDRVLVAFSWCLAKADEQPQQFSEQALLWEYKWAIFNALQFSQVDRSQIEEMLADYGRRLQKNGYSPRPASYLRMQYDFLTGRLDEAQLRLAQWLAEPRDRFADCPACELDNQVELLFYLRRDDEAARTARPLVEGGLSCAEVPHRTYATMLLSAMRCGDQERAQRCHWRGYELAQHKLDLLRQVGLQALYVARQRDHELGLELLERHLPLALAARIPRDRLDFCVGAAALARSFADRPLAIRLPQAHPLHCSGELPAPELAQWLQSQADELCEHFDRRNDNHWQSDLCRHYRQLAEAQ